MTLRQSDILTTQSVETALHAIFNDAEMKRQPSLEWIIKLCQTRRNPSQNEIPSLSLCTSSYLSQIEQPGRETSNMKATSTAVVYVVFCVLSLIVSPAAALCNPATERHCDPFHEKNVTSDFSDVGGTSPCGCAYIYAPLLRAEKSDAIIILQLSRAGVLGNEASVMLYCAAFTRLV